MRDDVMEIKKELEEVREKSFAMELLKDYKKANKRQFIIILVILTMWFATIGYLVYVLNDIGVIEETQTIEDIEIIENSTIQNGGK
jgi:hypothetical protein